MKFHPRWAVSALIVVASSVSTLAHAAAVPGQGTWETTLQGRDLDGNLATFEAYYDTDLNITWLADANHAQTSGFDANGGMNWSTANAWVAGLNPYGSGITGWRLPTITDTGTAGCNFAYTGTDCGYNVNTATGEMAHMFYTTLGDMALYNSIGITQAGSGLTNTGPFSNILNGIYVSVEYAPDTSQAWYFSPYDGIQRHYNKNYEYHFVWAVHSGDVAPVPVPAAAWLFGSGLLGLIGFARRRSRSVN